MTFTFELTEEETKIMSEALANMPFGKVVALVQKLQTQLQKQQKPPTPEE